MSRNSNSSRISTMQASKFQNTRLYGDINAMQNKAKTARQQFSTNPIPVISTPQPIRAPPTESHQMKSLLKLFHGFGEKLALLISHNSTNHDFRTILSESASNCENLFQSFYKQASQQFGTMPVMRQGVKPGLVSSTSALKKSSVNFLKAWREFSTTLIESQIYGPDSIEKMITEYFDNVQVYLQTIFNGKPETTSIHETVHCTCRQYQIQLTNIQEQVFRFIGNPSSNYKSLEEDIKEYSRRILDSFQHEFQTSGLSQTALLDLKNKSYSTLSDIIHGLKSASLFNIDIHQTLEAFDTFQSMLSIILERLNIPQSYLVIREKATTTSTPISPRSLLEDEIEFEDVSDFDNELDLFEIIEQGQRMAPKMAKETEIFNNFIKILRKKAKEIDKDLNQKIQECKKLENEKEEETNNYEGMLETERFTNQSMSEEIAKLKEEIEIKDKELDYLRRRTEDNEFKKCLRQVARQLGGVIKEESINFEDEDDDQLIQYVNALSVYVVERKCTHCAAYAKKEEKVKEMFNVISKKKIDNEDVIDAGNRAIERVNKLRDKYQKAKLKKKQRKEEIKEIKKGIHNILNILNCEQNNDNELIHSVIQGINNLKNDYNEQINDLKKQRIDDLNKCLNEILEKVEVGIKNKKEIPAELEHNNRIDYVKSIIFSYITEILSNRDSLIAEKNSYHECLVKAKEKLVNHLKIDPPDLSLCESILFMIDKIQNTTNPLQPIVAKLETDYHSTITTLDIVANRLRGIVQYDKKDLTSNMDKNELQTHIMKLLHQVQDMFDQSHSIRSSLTSEKNLYRKTLETIDLHMHQYLDLQNFDLKQLDQNSLTSRVIEFTDEITKPFASKNYMKIADVNQLFQTQSIFPIQNSSDPKQYVPEIISVLLKYVKSIEELKPFSQILDETFKIFDCKIESFNPNTKSFQDIKSKIIEMNSKLDDVSPVKINSVVFNMLQRFISLLSALIASLESYKDAAFITTDE